MPFWALLQHSNVSTTNVRIVLQRLAVDGVLQFKHVFLVPKTVQVVLNRAIFLGSLVHALNVLPLLIVEPAKFTMLIASGAPRTMDRAIAMETFLDAL